MPYIYNVTVGGTVYLHVYPFVGTPGCKLWDCLRDRIFIL